MPSSLSRATPSHSLQRGLAILLAATLAPGPTVAQQMPQRAPLKIVRDAETEALLSDYARPIFKAAGIKSTSIQIVLIQDRRFNAFVADGQHIFINTGVLTDARTPNEVIGVLAHESGHIAGGHLVRLRDAMAKAQTMATIGMIMGAGAIAAGALTNSGSGIQGGAAAIAASGGIAQRTFLSYVRTEELSADRAAITFLERTGQSGAGMLQTFRKFANEVMLSQLGIDPYLQSHPMPQERLSQLETLAQASKFYATKDPPALQARHDLMRAKLVAFTEAPGLTERLYPSSDTSLAARYARAVIGMRTKTPAQAVAQIDQLLAEQPNNPWFWELKGQTLLEGGKPVEAIAPLRRATSLAPEAGQLRILLGRALVASNNKSQLDEAIGVLQAAAHRDQLDSSVYRYLAQAYNLKGETAKGDLMVARGLFVSGNIPEARKYANRAQGQFSAGSREWLMADDIVSYKPKL